MEYLVNVILENMVDQVNSNDWDVSLFDEIVSATKDNKVAIKKGEGAFIMVIGTMKSFLLLKVGISKLNGRMVQCHGIPCL